MNVEYQDTVRLLDTAVNAYGTETVVNDVTVPAVVELNTGYNRANNQEAILSDAIVRPLPTNQFIVNNFNRLEGMLLIIEVFGDPVSEAWYRIESVTVYRDTQLGNTIDNIELGLKKTGAITGVS